MYIHILICTFSEVSLNGRVLKLIDDNTLPPVSPVTMVTSGGFTLDSLTYVFIVFPQAQYKCCL